MVRISVADPDPGLLLNTDPDPGLLLNTDPDHGFLLNTDPDPGTRFSMITNFEHIYS